MKNYKFGVSFEVEVRSWHEENEVVRILRNAITDAFLVIALSFMQFGIGPIAIVKRGAE